MADRYRGTTAYVHVLAELVGAAEYRGVTTYQDIAVIMGLPTWGNNMGRETGEILGEISTDEVAAGRPMLSAIAVDVKGKVGPGFFKLAKWLGRMAEGDDEQSFLDAERVAVYAAWKRPILKRDHDK